MSHYLDVSTEKNVDNNYTKDDVLSVSGDYGIVNQIEFKGRSFAGESVSYYGIVKSGDVVYTKSPLNSNPFGIIKANKGKAGIVSTLYAIYHPKNNVVSNFIQNYFEQNARVNNYLHPLVNKGAKNDMKVSSENALKGIVVFPGLYEQTIISSMFAKLDNIITLHQREYFSQFENINRHAYPWEQRKLGDLSSSFEYGLNAAAKKYDGENKYIRITDIDDDSREFVRTDLSSPDTDLSNAENYRLSEGDILFARTGASVGKSYIYRISDGLVYYAGFLIKARIKNFFNPEFVFQNTLKTDYERFIKVTSIRSGQPGVNAQEYAQYEIMVPSRLEQDKVSTYMNKLDNLITLHQRE